MTEAAGTGQSHPADRQLRLVGWRPGLRKVSLDHLLHEHFGMTMRDAFDAVNRLLDHRVVTVTVPAGNDMAAEQRALEDLGVIVRGPDEGPPGTLTET